MKINILISVFAIALLYSTNVTAQNKEDTKINRNEVKVVTVVKTLHLKALKVSKQPVFVNRKRDLINSQVNSKIKCSIDLFTIVNDKATC